MSTKSPEADTHPDEPTCGLDGCSEPLPPRPRDELGRPKGGRRARYCSKAHADAASRQRRATDLASIADPLALAREATAGVLPAARQLSEQLSSLIARFEQAENGALARVQAAETEAEQAHAEAARAAESEQQAEHARREALALARKDREEKDSALKRVERAHAEAEQIRDDAWKQVAEHERSRGQAEAELNGVRTALQALRREHAELLENAQDQRSRITQLDLQLATTGVELRQAGERVVELTGRLEQTEQQHRESLAAAQSAAQTAQAAQAVQARQESENRQAAERRDAELERARLEIAQLRSQLRAQVETSAGNGGKIAAGVQPARAPKPGRRRPRVAGARPADRPQ